MLTRRFRENHGLKLHLEIERDIHSKGLQFISSAF